MSPAARDTARDTAPAPVHALVVGAGAVGQVYGRHLARGGARVAWLVHDRHAAAVREGFDFYPLALGRPASRAAREHTAVAADDVLTTPAEVAARRFDQVYLALSSAQIRTPDIAALLAATGDATVVALQPGAADRAHLLAHVAAERLVSGLVTLIAYQAPLPGEAVAAPGMAYWLPPLAPAPYSGVRARAVVATLRAGGMPSLTIADVPARVALPSAVMMPLLTGLEAAGWSFRALADPARLDAVRAAAAEALTIVAPPRGAASLERHALLAGLHPLGLRAALGLGPRLAPFDVETYCRVHFTKVVAQTRLHMAELIAAGRRRGLPTRALEALGPA